MHIFRLRLSDYLVFKNVSITIATLRLVLSLDYRYTQKSKWLHTQVIEGAAVIVTLEITAVSRCH